MSGDAELLRRSQTDPAAFEALYRRHIRKVMGYAARRCSRPEDVADLVATTFVAVLESADRYVEARGEVLPWILGIACHVAADEDRRVRRERAALTRVAGQRELEPDEFAALEDQIDAARRRPEVERAWQALPVRYRDVLWLVGAGELDSRQAAHALGLTAPAFRMRLMRARRALSKSLAACAHPSIAAEAAPEEATL